MGQLSDGQFKTRAGGTRESHSMELLGEEGILQVAKTRAKKVIEYVHDGLGSVYSDNDKYMVEQVRTVLDLESELRDLSSSIRQLSVKSL